MWHSYLINLDKNQERLKNSQALFAAEKIPFTRVEAVNGWELDDDTIAGVYDDRAAGLRYKYRLIKPEIGCYLSHIKSWEMIVESGADGGFVFEDDFTTISPLAPILEALSKGEQDWDIVKLFSLREHPKHLSSAPLTDDHNLVVPYQVPTCLLGYGITRQAAEKLANTSVPFFRPVDEDHKFFWEKGLRVSLVTPSPITVGDQQAATGTIGGERKSGTRSSLISRISRSLKSLAYQISYKTKLHYHRKFGKHS